MPEVWECRSRVRRVRGAMRICASGLVLAGVLLFARGSSGQGGDPGFDAVVSPYGELFPALILALDAIDPAPPGSAALASGQGAAFGDQDGLIGASVAATRDDEAVELQVDIPALDAQGRLAVRLPQAGERYTLLPVMRWDHARLLNATAGDLVPYRLTLLRDGVRTAEVDGSVRLHAAAEAPYFVNDGAASADLGWIFAAYVDERAPEVGQLWREAGSIEGVEDGHGNPSNDEGTPGARTPESTHAQVFRLWHALESRGLAYSPLTTRSSVRGRVYVQRVRPLAESLAGGAANCVDGSVLIASALRAAGIDAALVRVPGHMFLRYALDEDGGRQAYLETTLLNDARAERSRSEHRVSLDRDASPALRASLRRFESALASGAAQYRKAERHFARGDSPEYRVIDVSAARRLGVQPIATGSRASASEGASTSAGGR